MSENDPGCVKTLRGITAPGILSPLVMRRAKKCKNLPPDRRYDQFRFRFRTTKTLFGHEVRVFVAMHAADIPNLLYLMLDPWSRRSLHNAHGETYSGVA